MKIDSLTRSLSGLVDLFEGKEILGKPVFSMQRGKTLIEHGEMKSEQGNALYLPGDVNLTASAPKGHRVK